MLRAILIFIGAALISRYHWILYLFGAFLVNAAIAAAFGAVANRLIGQGASVAEVLQHLEVTEATYYRWRNQYGAMGPDEAKRLKELEVENARLKKLLAEAELDKAILKEVAEGKW